jgi:hypothetical protein
MTALHQKHQWLFNRRHIGKLAHHETPWVTVGAMRFLLRACCRPIVHSYQKTSLRPLLPEGITPNNLDGEKAQFVSMGAQELQLRLQANAVR